jgi:exonuclease SbcD
LNIKKMVEYNLKEFNNAKVTELGTELLKELSEGDFKAAETIAHNFYEDLYDN